MSLYKAIKHKKEHRKLYRGAKAVDDMCRNHGNCSYCEEGRLYNTNKNLIKTDYELKEFLEFYNIKQFLKTKYNIDYDENMVWIEEIFNIYI